MAASPTDLFTQATTSSRPTPTQVTSTRSAAGATLACNALTGWPTATAVHFCTYKINTSGAKIAGSQIDMKGIVSGTNITNVTIKAGTDVGNAVGDIVEAAPTAAWANDVVAGMTTQHTQLGAHTGITTDTLTATSTINTSTQGNLQDGSIALQTMRSENTFDYVASGCVWTADAPGSTRNASMTAGVVYIGGKRVAVAAVTARSFTASKDTYVDVDNTGTIVYTEVTNNTISPALTANSVRLAIPVTAAGSFATAASVNQGQEDRILPIVASVAYSVTDGLGNLICPRDPNRKTLGFRQITGAALTTTSTTATQAAGLSCSVIVPTGRKAKISIYSPKVTNSGAPKYSNISIWDGTVGSGTQLIDATQLVGTAGQGNSMNCEIETTPAVSAKTYNFGFTSDSGGGVTTSVTQSSTSPSYVKVELA